jgi:predicted RNA-binding Zn-ribbon protein involved in translation (DUF1610 family)
MRHLLLIVVSWPTAIAIVIVAVYFVLRHIYYKRKELDEKLRADMETWPRYFRCIHCGQPFIPPDSYYLPTCPSCGQTTNTSGQKPFSHKDLIDSRKRNPLWRPVFLELISKGDELGAIQFLEGLLRWIDLDEDDKYIAGKFLGALKKRKGI